jgi:2-oxoglutarate ferredoxin oxidoreductase subunit gamma
MDVDLLLTGVGGQGIQLAAKTLALAATRAGCDAMLSATYGGQMRGGQTEATVVVRDDRIVGVPPILPSASAAVVAHSEFWPPVRDRLRPEALVVIEEAFFDESMRLSGARTFVVPAVAEAEAAGVPSAATFVLVAAYNEIAGVVDTERLVEAMRELVPAYRADRVEANERALRLGAIVGARDAAVAHSGEWIG